MRKSIPKKYIVSYILGTLFLCLAIDVHMAGSWTLQNFPGLDFSAIIFHLMVPLEGANTAPFHKIIIKCVTLGPLMALCILWLVTRCRNTESLQLTIYKWKLSFPLNWCKRFYALFAFLTLFAASSIEVRALGIGSWARGYLTPSTVFDDYYVDPRTTTVSFPESRKNLIYIFMESMETSYTTAEYGGNHRENLIPELVQLSLEHTNFTASRTQINGGYSPVGTTWTIGGMVAQTAGVPLLIPIDGNAMDTTSSFLPGAYTLGDMLADQGYTQEFLLGSDVTFGGRKNYMSQHGNYKLADYNYAIQQGWIPSDYRVFWGYEDQKLYEFAKNELLELSRQDQPFHLTMLTVDTHFTDGYVCDLCEQTYPEQFSNVLCCASRQLKDFITWIQQQDFYEDTVIVIAGDHPTMDTAYLQRNLPDVVNEHRRTYVAFINPALSYELEYDRAYSTLDLYPTTIAALGAQIEGQRLGLGVNLFSDTPTLVETLGMDYLCEEFSKTSSYYNRNLLY